MHNLQYIHDAIVLLSATVIVVTVFKWINLSPVLGYFIAGAIIGQNGIALLADGSGVDLFAELGVVFLLFVIGIEFTLERLLAMRRYVFGFGTLQVLITFMVICIFCLIMGYAFKVAAIISAALSMSSTAIVMQVLKETGSQSTQVGRLSVATLLMQDFVVVPLLVLIPLLANGVDNMLLGKVVFNALVKALVALIVMFIGGRLFLRPLFNTIGKFASNELFVATTLLVVLSSAYITEQLNLSMALGAFMSGLMVAETVYRYEIEHAVLPFKELLLGLFFMTVGMSINVVEFLHRLTDVSIFVIVILFAKSSIIFILARIFNFSMNASIKAGLLLAQGSEFAFILFNLARQQQIIDHDLAQTLMMAVTITMALTPLLSGVSSYVVRKFIHKDKNINLLLSENADLDKHVIVVGFSNISRILAKVLSSEQINYVILDINAEVVRAGKKDGYPIYRGDINDLGTLKAVGADHARAMVIAIHNEITFKRTIINIKNNFKNTVIVGCVPSSDRAKEYSDLGVSSLVMEDREIGIRLSEEVLCLIGFSNKDIEKIIKNEPSVL